MGRGRCETAISRAIAGEMPHRSTRGAAVARTSHSSRGSVAGLTLAGDFAPLMGKALDDEDAEVCRVAFVETAVAHPSLGAWLQSKDEEFGRALSDVTRRVATPGCEAKRFVRCGLGTMRNLWVLWTVALTARFRDLRARAVEELAALSLKPGGPLAAPLTRLAQTLYWSRRRRCS